MLTSVIRRIVLTAAIAVAAPLAAGCHADVEAQVPAYEGYEPMYTDDGYVVYYDAGGAPYYYVGNRVVYVQPTHPYYGRYTTYYRSYGPRYHRWYTRYGYRYHNYRSPRYYRR
jgi:hypothetical protein